MRYLFTPILALSGIVAASPDSLGCQHIAAQFGAACPVCDGPAAGGGGFSSSYGYSQQAYAAPVVQAQVQTFSAPVVAPVQQSTVTYSSTAAYSAPQVVQAPAVVSTYAAPMIYAAPAYGMGYSSVGLGGMGYGSMGNFGVGGYGGGGFGVSVSRFRGVGPYGGINRGFSAGIGHGHGGNGFGFAGGGYR